jgi:GNAT superfamily N-acetyltransferase
MSYSIRAYKEGDEENIVSLLDLVFDGWPNYDLQVSNKEYWRWKHKPSMKYDTTVAVCVNHENHIIGCIHRLLFHAKIGEKDNLIQHGTDLAVHPNYRRRGISNELRQKVPMNYLRYGSTVNPLVKNAHLNQGALFQSPIYVYKKIFNYDIYKSKNKVNKTWLYRHQILEKMDKIKFEKKERKYKVKLIKKFDEGINRFWNYVKKDYDFSINKTMDYLNWRYCDFRSGDFKVFQVEEENRILGYGVTRINRVDPYKHLGLIVELEVINSDKSVADSIISEIDHFFDQQKVNERNLWVVRDSKISKMIRGHGYVNTYWDIYVHMNNNDGSMLDLLEYIPKIKPDRINFQMGDTDSI